jgi:hypothetical protein
VYACSRRKGENREKRDWAASKPKPAGSGAKNPPNTKDDQRRRKMGHTRRGNEGREGRRVSKDGGQMEGQLRAAAGCSLLYTAARRFENTTEQRRLRPWQTQQESMHRR